MIISLSCLNSVLKSVTKKQSVIVYSFFSVSVWTFIINYSMINILVVKCIGLSYKQKKGFFMYMHKTHKRMMQVSSLALVLLLSGCEWFGGKKEAPSATGKGAAPEVISGETVIATMGGKPVLTVKEFEERFEQLMQGQPQLRAMLQYMPDLKIDVAKSLVSQSVIDKYVEENSIDKQADYKNDLEQARTQAQKIVNVKYFRNACVKPVTESDVKKYYEEHKDEHPELLLSRGGIPASGVSFDKDADAKAFLAKVTGKNAEEFKKIAEADKLGAKIRNFGFVNAQSLGMDVALRDKIVAIKKPATETIKVNDKTFWVVNVGAKQETKYRPFEEVKDGLSKFLANRKMEEAMEQKLDELKGKYNVKINEDILKAKAPEEPAKAAATVPAPEAQQPEASARPA
jgi:peptidyl-prolyl cis-trans isomerase C